MSISFDYLLRRLNPFTDAVVVFRFGRHTTTNKSGMVISQKLSTWVSFPSQGLDMSSFTSASLLGRPRDGTDSEHIAKKSIPRLLQSAYSLYAVIVHFGTLDQGHYIAYVRVGSAWFKCADATVTAVQQSEVLDSEACVYQRLILRAQVFVIYRWYLA